jgi:Protein of unknown function (DUF3717)
MLASVPRKRKSHWSPAPTFDSIYDDRLPFSDNRKRPRLISDLDTCLCKMPPLGNFTIQALEQAINRARQANPAHGAEASLSPEVAKLAALYGWMIYEGRQELSPDLLNADEMDALSRWI